MRMFYQSSDLVVTADDFVILQPTHVSSRSTFCRTSASWSTRAPAAPGLRRRFARTTACTAYACSSSPTPEICHITDV
jgi:hypothetical protein